MPPKKRDKEPDPSKIPRMDQLLIHQANHELFLQAFEKPTQIYRFMRTRVMLSPIFLNRTLSYMSHRMTRSHKSRKNFKVNNILGEADKNKKTNKTLLEHPQGFMTLTFLGFYHQREVESVESVKVETLLLKIGHKKRKDAASAMMQVSMGNSEVPSNPSTDRPPPKAATISIPTESFNHTGHLAKSYTLVLRATCTSQTNILTTQQNQTAEPASKRRKSSKLFGTELIVYDKQNRCQLIDGDYDLVLHEMHPLHTKSSPKKPGSWETIGESVQDPGVLDEFNSGPILKFRLNWTLTPSNSVVDWPAPHQQLDQNKENIPINSDVGEVSEHKEQRLQIIYQFLYNNNSRQQTEACEDLTCPWCSLDCVTLYSLLKHLKLCHARFIFTYVPIATGARIDVAINDLYDGSYTGSPFDLAAQPPGMAFSRNGPVRRTVASNVLVCHPKRPKPSLSEFLEQDPDQDPDTRINGYMTGHNRLYHHTVTMMPVYPKEMDSDSEGEHDPLWLQTKTMMMIDEFTDVNEGEKELMKMWNLHVMKHGYVGDCQIPLACLMFLDNRGRDLLLKNLYRNFVLHMCSLFDFGLVSPVTLYTTVMRLQDLLEQTPGATKILQQSIIAQQCNKQTTKRKCLPSISSPSKVRDQRRKSTANVELPQMRRKSLNQSLTDSELCGS